MHCISASVQIRIVNGNQIYYDIQKYEFWEYSISSYEKLNRILLKIICIVTEFNMYIFFFKNFEICQTHMTTNIFSKKKLHLLKPDYNNISVK